MVFEMFEQAGLIDVTKYESFLECIPHANTRGLPEEWYVKLDEMMPARRRYYLRQDAQSFINEYLPKEATDNAASLNEWLEEKKTWVKTRIQAAVVMEKYQHQNRVEILKSNLKARDSRIAVIKEKNASSPEPIPEDVLLECQSYRFQSLNRYKEPFTKRMWNILEPKLKREAASIMAERDALNSGGYY
jgi:hypothetical protein